MFTENSKGCYKNQTSRLANKILSSQKSEFSQYKVNCTIKSEVSGFL